MNNSQTARENIIARLSKAIQQAGNTPVAADRPVPPPLNNLPEIHFAEALTAAGGHFVYCATGIEFIENLIALAENHKWSNIYCWEPLLQEIFSIYEFPFISTSAGLSAAQVGITLADALIARTGTVVITSANAGATTLAVNPPVHIVIATPNQLVNEPGQAYAALQAKYGKEIPSLISFITGNTVKEKSLYVLLVDDFT